MEKRAKIDSLRLRPDEWENVDLFNGLLAVCLKLLLLNANTAKHADNAQQAFSSDQAPTLHLALPALEALHKAWSVRQDRVKYQDFVPALESGLAKIEEYYNRTADSDAYTFAMRCVFPLVCCRWSLTGALYSS